MLKGIEIDILYYLQENKIVGDYISKKVFGVETCITCEGLHALKNATRPRDIISVLEKVFNVVMFIEDCRNGDCKIHINITTSDQKEMIKSVETEYLLDEFGVNKAIAYTIASNEKKYLHFKLSDNEEKVFHKDVIMTAITAASIRFNCELKLLIGYFKKGRFVLSIRDKEKIEEKKENTADEMKALISILTVLNQNHNILRDNNEYVEIISTYIKQFKKK